MSRPTKQQMRDMGYRAEAEPIELSDRAWVAFCAWLNIAPDKVQPHMRWKPADVAEAWERTATAAVNAAQPPSGEK